MKIVGIILAAGRGTRMYSQGVNKVTLPFSGRPMVQYGVELFQSVCKTVYLVIGAYAQSVKDALQNYNIEYVHQSQPHGTGDAVRVTLSRIAPEVEYVLVGYADHMMFYRRATVEELIHTCKPAEVALSMVTTTYQNPDALGFAHVIKNERGLIHRLVEHKDANEEERRITTLNAGLYCFKHSFLKKNIDKIQKSSVTGEYYLTDLIDIAISAGMTVADVKVPFAEVGIGINTPEQLRQSQELFQSSS